MINISTMGAMRARLPLAILSVAASCCVTAGTNVARAEDFYAGKSINFIVGSAPGGGYDTYSRTIARHWPKFIAGNPNIVVKNQPGAGSAVAAALIYTTAPKNGLWLGAIFPGAIIGAILDPRPKTKFDPSKFIYIGSADAGTRICLTGPKSKIKTFEDAQKTKTIMGASQAGGSTRDYAFMLNKTAGSKFDVVSGYKGSRDIFLAMERGEVDGMCGLDWSSMKSQQGDWLRDGKAHVLIQAALDPEPELDKMKVPSIWKYITKDDDKKAVRLIVSQQVYGRPYVAPPGTPAETVKILRDAFMKTMKDKEFLADAEKVKLSIEATSGEKVNALIAEVFSTPKAIVDHAKSLIKP